MSDRNQPQPMTFWLFIRRSLRFHARNHFGVVLGAAIGSAALIGALIVGDSVRGSLRGRALTRLGSIAYAMSTGDRFFEQALGGRLEINHFDVQSQGTSIHYTIIGPSPTTLLQVTGTAARQDGRARVNQINVLGVDLTALAGLRGRPPMKSSETRSGIQALLDETDPTHEPGAQWAAGNLVLLNDALAKQLGVVQGDEILIRVRKPSQLAQDAAISPREDTSLALRLRVGPNLSPEFLGDFGLNANQTAPANAFLPLDFFSRKLGLEGRANIAVQGQVMAPRNFTRGDLRRFSFQEWLLAHWPSLRRLTATSAWLNPFPASMLTSKEALQVLATRIEDNWSLEDAQLSVHAIDQPQTATGGETIRPSIEVATSRIFLDPAVISAALKPRTRLLNTHSGFTSDNTNDLELSGFVTNGTGILTYLANLLRNGDRATPYSMITAAGGPYVPPDMRDDEILINEWLAEDLQAKPGDSINVSYYAVDSASRLTERTNSFRVRAIISLKGIYADRTLMPDFPGVAKAENTQDWDTGFPLVNKIREKDEAYWKRYRGTPKAFITLAAGQAMWATRFGNLTAIRYEVPTNSVPEACRALVYKNLLANLNPAELGFRFQPVREQALAAANQSQDFGQLFIGFSIFLVVAALLLMALLFQFSLEQRRAEVGTLLALGLKPKQVRRLLLGEGVVLALVGGMVGAAAGVGYAKGMLWALTTVWRNAIGLSVLHFYASATTLLIGLFASVIVASLTIWLTLRKQARQPARELLAGEAEGEKHGRGLAAKWIASLSGLAGLAVVSYAVARGDRSDAEVFFEAGSLLLMAGLASAAIWLRALEARTHPLQMSFAGLGVRGCARRRKRSLATIALLACGCFVIVSIGAFRLDANRDALKASSGTGGFALIGQATLPVVQDLNSQSGREFFGLSPKDFMGVSTVAFRVHDGDEASCLNLNRAQHPRLLGVNPDLLAGRFTFAEVAKGLDIHQGWTLLKSAGPVAGSNQSEEIPAIGDANSIQWALGKSIGDTIDYTDERGRAFKLRLVGAVANSVLQGSLIIDESAFVQKFPSESGYRFFLIDTPPAGVASISATLSRALQDSGLELTPAAERLNAFNAVQNTYLGTFQILGGLGLLLGSAGLGIVVLRNVLERRGELGLLLAVGFRKRALQWLVVAEHSALLGLGLALGVLAAAVAVLPALLSPARELPYGSLGVTLVAVLVNGALWTWIATRVALRGNLLAALRNE
jgi:putative ABC transport system permease protein